MEELIGRELLLEELKNSPTSLTAAEKRPGFTINDQEITCNRCGSNQKKHRARTACTCGENCFYCTNCLQMGKVKSCSTLYHLPETNQFPMMPEPILTWTGTLSKQQQAASDDIVATIERKETRLIWAVTGAGKTEMLFQGIALALQQKKRVCIASPRVDVCLELGPRLQKAFASVQLAVLHGAMEEDYRYTQLVIATTHQLLRFKEAFDVLIIDEVDAFPFYLDQTLQFAANKAKKKTAALIYLSATPNKQLQAAVAKKRLLATILPARYHGFILPVPVLRWIGNWQEMIQKKQKGQLYRLICQLLSNKRRFLLFVPNIHLMQQLEVCLQEWLPDLSFASVFAADEKRREKVQAMRDEKLDCLLTTTILERGVTFRDIDVLVLGAEDRTFTEAALVQIAGRAGRHKDYPEGLVLYLHHGRTKEMIHARQQILSMNRLAKKRGLIK